MIMADQSSSSSSCRGNDSSARHILSSNESMLSSSEKEAKQSNDVSKVGTLVYDQADLSGPSITDLNNVSSSDGNQNIFHSPFGTDSASLIGDSIPRASTIREKDVASKRDKSSSYVPVNEPMEPGPSGVSKKRARNVENGDEVNRNDRDGSSVPKLGRFDTPSTVFDAVEMLHRHFPTENPSSLYDRLENAPDFKQECWKMVADLIDKKAPQVNGDAEEPNESLFSKVAAILAIYPAEDPNRLYSRLESVNSSLLDETVQQILQELEVPTQTNDYFPEGDLENVPGPSHALSTEFEAYAKTEFLTNEDKNKVRHICSMFPNVDHRFLIEEIVNAAGEFNMEQFIEERMVPKRYPTLKDRIEKERIERLKAKLTDPAQFNVEEFLEIFEDPETYFMDTARPITNVYEQCAIACLENEFPHLTKRFIQQQLVSFNNHFLPAIRYLAVTEPNTTEARGTSRRNRSPANKAKYRAQNLRNSIPIPEIFEEIFYRELQFYRHAQKIQDYLDTKKAERQIAIENARQAGLLDECQCCFSDEVLPHDIFTCNSGHKFCEDCIKSQAKEVIGRGGHLIKCLADNCDNSYSIPLLKTLLNSQLTSLILRRTAEEDLRLAGIENLKQCKYCDFQMVIDNPDEKVFQCRNPQCLKEYCLLCEEPNHIPLRCEEVEKADETAMRLYIEDKMAMALIRQCPQCNKKIVKDDGCNHMRCVCGCDFCYVCGRLYQDHENGQYCIGNQHKLHVSDVRRAGEKAKKTYMKDHPDLRRARAPDIKKLTDTE